jgi:transposase
MYCIMEDWTTIRRQVLVEGQSKRSVLRESGMHWKTLEKVLAHSQPPGYRLKRPRAAWKVGRHLERIVEILKEDEGMPRKQRHTVKRIYERLKEGGYDGGYGAVWQAVGGIRTRTQEVFMPLVHRPGEAQVDFGFALVKVKGVLRKTAFFVMTLPYSTAIYVQVFERECTETFWEGHVRAFVFFNGVAYRISYDNSRVAVVQIIGGVERKLTTGFLQLQSHYLFAHHFCRVRRAHEKGVVEGMVRFTRLNFFVPVPQVENLEELNVRLEQQCREDLKRTLRGRTQNKAGLMDEERAAFLPLPAAAFEASRKTSTTASSLSLVRFDHNDYSVPVGYAHHPVVVRGLCSEVRLSHLGQEIARHKRIWDKEQVCFDPLHYLALLERKPGALDYARPLEQWKLSECFGVLRRRLENERKGEGTRQYIGVLRLLEKHPMDKVAAAIEKGLTVGALTRDAIAQFLFPGGDWRAATFALDEHPHLRHVHVALPDVSVYQTLLAAGRRSPRQTLATQAGGAR